MGILDWFTGKGKAHKKTPPDLSDIDKRLLKDVDKKNLQTSLHIAAASNQLDVAEELTRRGAEINSQNVWGATPLHLAASNDNPEMVELLLRNGADRTIENEQGYTPLKLAQELGLRTAFLPAMKIAKLP